MQDDFLQVQLDQRQAQNALRSLPAAHDLIDFCSNDYLGFAKTAENQNFIGKPGSTGSRLISGNTAFAEALEQKIARFHHAEAGLLFTSGYAANLGLLSCIATRHDTILYDALSHASIRDGIRLSPAKAYSFYHNDVNDLQKKLKNAVGRIFIIIESIYSMDGDAAPLMEICNIAKHYDAYIIVDEAHSTGVCGPHGEGLTVELNLQNKVWARIYTFGKAIGSHGAIVVGSATLRNYLINFSRPFIYTTAPPEHTLQSIDHAYNNLLNNSALKNLHQNIQLFLQSLSVTASAYFVPSQSPIQCLIWQGNDRVKAFAQAVQAAGFDVRPILHPTVPQGQERLRICIHAFNKPSEITALTNFINNYITSYSV
ncbi:MAG: aminotransferase class I/II-fold pyridoxal phosphate-dependent enzyme [Saprospiraceae bacterium]